jgi:hypothetical protein
MLGAVFEPTTPEFEKAEEVAASDRVANSISNIIARRSEGESVGRGSRTLAASTSNGMSVAQSPMYGPSPLL